MNFYAEADSPKAFVPILGSVMAFVVLLIGVAMGYVGYFAFGDKANGIILINLPTNNWVGITAKIFYTLTILGSFAILLQPIFNIIEGYEWYNRVLGIGK